MSQIVGIGHVSACGVGLDALRDGLNGRIRPAGQSNAVQTPGGEVVVTSHPAEPAGLDRIVPPRKLRRLDRFAQMALLASALALEEAGGTVDRDRLGLIFATGHGPLGATFGFQDGIIDGGDREASPATFTNSVHNMPASQVSIVLGLAGPNVTLTAPELSAAPALATAETWLRRGDVDAVLVGCGDELCPMSLYATACLGDGCPYEPGEGFTALVLARQADAPASQTRIESVRLFDSPEAARPALDGRLLMVAEDGDRRAASHYRRLPGDPAGRLRPAACRGGLATGQGFDVAAAALMLRDGRIHAPGRDDPLPEGAGLACVQCSEDGTTAVIELKR